MARVSDEFRRVPTGSGIFSRPKPGAWSGASNRFRWIPTSSDGFRGPPSGPAVRDQGWVCQPFGKVAQETPKSGSLSRPLLRGGGLLIWGLHWVLLPLSNSGIIIIIWLYIALNRTPNTDCYWVGGGSTQPINPKTLIPIIPNFKP